MHRRDDARRKLMRNRFSPSLRYLEGFPQQALSSRGSEANDDLGLQHGDLRLQPRTAGRNLQLVRFFVDATLPAWLPFEMLDRVGEVNLVAIDVRGFER